MAEKLLGDSRALTQSAIRPSGVPVRTLKKHGQALVRSGAKSRVQLIRMRPKNQRHAADFQDAAAHAFAALLRIGGKGRQRRNGLNLVANVGGIERNSAVDAMDMTVDQARK